MLDGLNGRRWRRMLATEGEVCPCTNRGHMRFCHEVNESQVNESHRALGTTSHRLLDPTPGPVNVGSLRNNFVLCARQAVRQRCSPPAVPASPTPALRAALTVHVVRDLTQVRAVRALDGGSRSARGRRDTCSGDIGTGGSEGRLDRRGGDAAGGGGGPDADPVVAVAECN